jgi:segregation and condensation protein A
MAERTLPWWRKVIDYAISGIRSLLRPARPNSGEMSEPADSREEISAKHESIPEQVPHKVEEPAARQIVASFLRNPDPRHPEMEPAEDTAATAAIEQHDPNPIQEPEPAIIAEEAPEPVAEKIVAEEPAAVPEESSEIEAPEPVPESVVEKHPEEKYFEEERIEEEHSEPAPIQEPTAAPEPIAEHDPISEQEPAAVPQPAAEVESEQVLMKEEAVEATEPAESLPAVDEISSMQQANPEQEAHLNSVQEETKQEVTEQEETEMVHIEAEAEEPIAAPEEPVAETAAEPPAESAAATPALEIEAPESQPEAEVPEVAAATPAATPVAPSPTPPPAPSKTEAELKTAARIVAAVKAREESADPSPFSILVDQVYDGPLDLLLDLIRKQDIDIYDIPIAKITAQFLAYVNHLKAGDVDVAGEFIYTASLLIHIKSKMLLPRAPNGPDDAAEDPRRELVERLLEHEKFKNAAQMLQQKQMLEAATWTNPGVREFKDDEAAEPEIAADTVDLVRIFQVILDRARNRPILNVEEDSVTVGQMIQFLTRRLTMEDKPVALSKLLSNTKSERALISMFLALLELVRLQAILLRQDRHFTDIFIKKNSGFETAMEQSLANARDDWR